MGLWSGDNQPSIEMVIAQAKAEARAEMLAKADAEDQPKPYEDDAVLTSSEPAAIADIADDTELYLPGHIAPGFYRAVDHEGRVQLVNVVEDEENRNAAKRDFYTHETDAQRWYLIRMNSPMMATSPKKSVIR